MPANQPSWPGSNMVGHGENDESARTQSSHDGGMGQYFHKSQYN